MQTAPLRSPLAALVTPRSVSLILSPRCSVAARTFRGYVAHLAVMRGLRPMVSAAAGGFSRTYTTPMFAASFRAVKAG